MSSSLDHGTKEQLEERLKTALGMADRHDLPFVAIRISEAIDALVADLDNRPDIEGQ